MDLQSAYIIQYSNDSGKTNWKVKDKDNNELGELPASLSEQEAMSILHFARNFENKAYEKGKCDIITLKNREIENLRLNYEAIIKGLKEENERLANLIKHNV